MELEGRERDRARDRSKRQTGRSGTGSRRLGNHVSVAQCRIVDT